TFGQIAVVVTDQNMHTGVKRIKITAY
ncbi:MAG: hypothetical protein RL563_2573, partial [Pseudomonadota bacterium]